MTNSKEADNAALLDLKLAIRAALSMTPRPFRREIPAQCFTGPGAGDTVPKVLGLNLFSSHQYLLNSTTELKFLLLYQNKEFSHELLLVQGLIPKTAWSRNWAEICNSLLGNDTPATMASWAHKH